MSVPPGDPTPSGVPDPTQPPAGQPPTPGGQPPAYGQQPPAYGEAPAYGQYGPPAGYDPNAAYGQAPRSSTKAIVSLVLAVVGLLFCPIVFSVAAIILGVLARRDIDASGGLLKGRGLATAGLVVGVIGLVLGIILVGVYVGG